VLDRSRRPKRSPACLDGQVVEAVLKMKADYPMWGPRKLHVLLSEQIGDACPSRATVGRILARRGLSGTRCPSSIHESVGRFERGEPNELWQTDFTAPFAIAEGRKVWPSPILDDRSRYCVSLIAAPDCSGASAVSTLRAGAQRYGLPLEVLSDHGSAFGVSRAHLSAFTAYLWALGVEHVQGRYAHPQTQGKLERFNQTLQRECIARHNYSTLEDWNKCFEEYRQLYNQIRPHQALSDRAPAKVYTSSPRPFAEPNREHREGGDELVHRRVDASGRIWLLQHHVKVGNGLTGWIVAAKHDGCGIWTIQFRGRIICQAQLAKVAPYKPRR
jgi:transposase InsO family protein